MAIPIIANEAVSEITDGVSALPQHTEPAIEKQLINLASVKN